MFFGSRGLASWLGKVPSSSKYMRHEVERAGPSKTVGTVWPPIPLPASTTTFSGRMPDRSTRDRRCSAYSASMSRSVTVPGAARGRGRRPVRPLLDQRADVGEAGVLADGRGARRGTS